MSLISLGSFPWKFNAIPQSVTKEGGEKKKKKEGQRTVFMHKVQEPFHLKKHMHTQKHLNYSAWDFHSKDLTARAVFQLIYNKAIRHLSSRCTRIQSHK